MADDADSMNDDSNSSPSRELEETTMAHITWLNIVQRHLRAYNLTLNEADDLAQNRPLRRLMSTYSATHS